MNDKERAVVEAAVDWWEMKEDDPDFGRKRINMDRAIHNYLASRKSPEIEPLVMDCRGSLHCHFKNDYVLTEKVNEVICHINNGK